MTGHRDLERFLSPQELTHAKALSELRTGLKLSHWIWWEMPQLRGLGTSVKSEKYGLSGLLEARMYLSHPLLGRRLVELCMALMAHRTQSPEAILGPVDARKVQSMATLFASVEGAPAVFQDILDGFFAGMRCRRTDEMLAT